MMRPVLSIVCVSIGSAARSFEVQAFVQPDSTRAGSNVGHFCGESMVMAEYS